MGAIVYICNITIYLKFMIDLIGDIHGYADKLEELLLKLGYKKNNGLFTSQQESIICWRLH